MHFCSLTETVSEEDAQEVPRTDSASGKDGWAFGDSKAFETARKEVAFVLQTLPRTLNNLNQITSQRNDRRLPVLPDRGSPTELDIVEPTHKF